MPIASANAGIDASAVPVTLVRPLHLHDLIGSQRAGRWRRGVDLKCRVVDVEPFVQLLANASEEGRHRRDDCRAAVTAA